MGLINFPNANQTQKTPTNNSGCLRRIIVLLAVAFVAYYLLKSCGGGLLNYGNGTSYEQRNSPSSNDNTITMPDMTPNSTTNSTNTTNTTTNSGDYSWIVGTWDCDMGAYGKVVMNFEGDGTSGRCSELQANGEYRYGTYHVDGNVLSYKLTGESFSTTIDIEPGHKLAAGGGAYYRKRN